MQPEVFICLANKLTLQRGGSRGSSGHFYAGLASVKTVAGDWTKVCRKQSLRTLSPADVTSVNMVFFRLSYRTSAVGDFYWPLWIGYSMIYNKDKVNVKSDL